MLHYNIQCHQFSQAFQHFRVFVNNCSIDEIQLQFVGPDFQIRSRISWLNFLVKIVYRTVKKIVSKYSYQIDSA